MPFGLGQRLLHRLTFNMPGGYTIRPWLHRLRGVNIGPRVWISRMVYIDELHPEEVTIGSNSSIGIRTSIITHFYWGPRRRSSRSGPVVIGEDVFVGPHCIILPDVTIGNGAVVLAGTVVSRDVPEGVLWGMPKAGAVARVTVPLTHDYSFDAFMEGLRPLRVRPPKHDSGMRERPEAQGD
ncbi:MAG: acyltransferase [Chitinivibrionales bacterium]|nr:acyltransferase [Chitinivibrionales bacterium]